MSDTLQNVVVCHPSLFSALEIERYEREILCNPDANERNASDFFARYPKFLFLGQGREIRREVVLVNSGTKQRYRVDFFKQKYGSSYWDIVELKDPQVPFMVHSDGGHPRLSTEVNKAISQAQDYRDWVNEDAFVRQELLRKGISVYRPEMLVVVGKDGTDPKPDALRRLMDRVRQAPIEAMSYTDIYRFAKEHYTQNSVIVMLGGFGIDRMDVSKDVLLALSINDRLTAALGKAFSDANLPFSGRAVKWEIERLDANRKQVQIRLFASRTLEQEMLMAAFHEVVAENIPGVQMSFSFDETSTIEIARTRMWKKRKDLDGE